MDSGDVYSWGKGSQGALGHSQLQDCFRPEKILFTEGCEHKITKVDSGMNHTVFIDVRGSVLVCGSNECG